MAHPAARDESSARRATAPPLPIGLSTNRGPVAPCQKFSSRPHTFVINGSTPQVEAPYGRLLRRRIGRFLRHRRQRCRFPTGHARTKLISLAVRSFERTGRAVKESVTAKNHFAVLYLAMSTHGPLQSMGCASYTELRTDTPEDVSTSWCTVPRIIQYRFCHEQRSRRLEM